MTLYLKYRPQTIDDLDSVSVRESLNKAMRAKSIPHAFLFAGPKGIGKTSAARIVAKMLNCTSSKKPCNKCEQCISITNGTNIDVIEMDAASNRGIDDVRALKDAIKLSPVSASKKVYIIDEAHMLTTEASNALLKTLEEPPNHVYFILATTNPEKLLETIRSRTTTINFRKATKEELKNALLKVAKKEKLEVGGEVINKIVGASGGSFRDAIKMLEQASVLKDSSQMFSGIDAEGIIKLLEEAKIKKALEKIEDAINTGASGELIADIILTQLRGILLSYQGLGEKSTCKITESELIYLIELILQTKRYIKVTPIEELPLEIAIIKWGKTRITGNTIPVNGTAGKAEDETGGGNIDMGLWGSILEGIKKVNPTMEALLRSCRPSGFNKGCLKLGVFYKFHKERLDEVKNRKMLEDALSSAVNGPVRIECFLQEKKPDTVLTNGDTADIIKDAEELFN